MSEQTEKYKAILRRYLPEEAVEPVYHFLTQKYQVKFIITPDRNSKLGDYRWPQRDRAYHQITVNGGLNPYMFLMVLVHEMAHLTTWVRHGLEVKPHGHEWQQAYAALLQQYLPLFPAEVQPLMQRYTRKVPLHGPTGKEIDALLRNYGEADAPEWHLLRDIPLGSAFVLLDAQDSRTFRLQEKRRTRYLCIDVRTGDAYTIPGTVRVALRNQ